MLKKLYTDSFATINDAKYCILIAIIIYLCSTAAGLLYPQYCMFQEELSTEFIEGFRDESPGIFVFKIFVRNLSAAYVATCLISLWGVVPAAAAIINGLILGWAIGLAPGASHFKAAMVLIPHGIFEVPAMIIGWGVGMWKGLGCRFSSRRPNYSKRFNRANVVYFTVMLPLLLVAAIIEGRYHIYKQFDTLLH